MASTSAPLLRSTPEAQGVSSAALLTFLNAIEASGLELHSLMLMRRGHVIAEGWWTPYAASNPHLLYSLSKSFTSTAAGFAIQEGYFGLDDSVLTFFPEEAPTPSSPHLTEMRVRDLLTMTTGHETDTLGPMVMQPEGNWVKGFLEQPVERAPGTHFVYNSGATYMVSAIVQKTTGQTLLEYLEPRLFKPLGIVNPIWQSCPRGINTGGWGLSLKTEEIARFGQFYLQNGQWNGEQLLSPEWVETATSAQVPNGDNIEADWSQGYGFQFWRCRNNAYRGDGAFGQFCVVMPDQEAVVAITSNVTSMQTVLDLLWLHLIPACSDAPQPADDLAQAQLQERLSQLEVRVPIGALSSPTAQLVSGHTYHFPENSLGIQNLSLEFEPTLCRFTVQDAGGKHHFACGLGQWHSQDTQFLQRAVWLETPRPDVWRLSAQGAWTGETTFTAKFCFDETPFSPLFEFHFDANRGLRLNTFGRFGFSSADVTEQEAHRA